MADTLYINEKHLGDTATAAQAKSAATMLKEKGYTVEYSDRADLPTPADSIRTDDWTAVVNQVSGTQPVTGSQQTSSGQSKNPEPNKR